MLLNAPLVIKKLTATNDGVVLQAEIVGASLDELAALLDREVQATFEAAPDERDRPEHDQHDPMQSGAPEKAADSVNQSADKPQGSLAPPPPPSSPAPTPKTRTPNPRRKARRRKKRARSHLSRPAGQADAAGPPPLSAAAARPVAETGLVDSAPALTEREELA